MHAIITNRRLSYVVYALAYVIASFLHGWLISGPRYLTSLPAVYILAAQIKNRTVRYALLFFCGMCAVMVTTLFMKGYSIM